VKRNRRERIDAELDVLWARIPDVHCRGLCQHSCTIIAQSEREGERAADAGVVLPDLNGAARRLLAHQGAMCPALNDDGRCAIYPVRPTICRLYGATTALRCPHGCRPDRLLTAEEGLAILADATTIGGAPPDLDIDGATLVQLLQRPDVRRTVLGE
jgi:Fe-S-cluster containining protein